MPEATSQPIIQSHFLDRISNLPAVVTALGSAKQSYNYVKDRNGLLGYTLSTAERSAAYAIEHSLPLLGLLSGPGQYVDSLACKGLDKIENSYPEVKKNQPDKIIQDAATYGIKKYEDAREYAVSLVRNSTSRAVHALAHPREVVSTAYQAAGKQAKEYTQTALSAAEDKLNRELSSLGVAVQPVKYEGLELANRVSSITTKTRAYVSNKAQTQYRSFQEYASKSAAQVQAALGTLQKLKNGLLDNSKSLKDILNELHLDANWLKALLNDPDPSTHKTLPSKVMVVSNNATHQVLAMVTERSKLARSLQENYARISPELNKRLAPIGKLATDSLINVYSNVAYVTDSCRRAALAALEYLSIVNKKQPRQDKDSNDVHADKSSDGECSSTCSESD
ncbi:unnamed protein product [Ixodes hexagonus]